MPKKIKSGKVMPNGNYKSYKFEKDFFQEEDVQMNKFSVSHNNPKEKHLDNDRDEWVSLLAQAKTVSKWLAYKSRRRDRCLKASKQKIPNEEYYENINLTLNGIASECESSSDDGDEQYITKNKKISPLKLSKSSNKALIIYFSKLARGNSYGDELDLDFVESLIRNGANVNTRDKYGQTIFHEVARTWHVDVAKFLLAFHGDINQADKFGRTALHIAAAVNYAEMVKYLIESGAKTKATTYGEKQTAVHYAAKNDAVDSLRMLRKLGCDIEVRDSKQRTPLQVAAELDRSETALFLVEEGAQVGVCDVSGLSILTLMIEKMPPVAKIALDQYHRTDRANRKQYFSLNLLEPMQPGELHVVARSPMQVFIICGSYFSKMQKEIIQN